MKKFLSVLLAVVLIITAMPLSELNFDVQAQTTRTQQEAVNWILNAEGKYWDWDGAYGAQCVDLIYYYYNYLGESPRGGNANSYIYDDSKVPTESGWQKIKCYNGFRAEPGDIALFDYGTNGHIGLISAGDVYGFTTLENNRSDDSGTSVAKSGVRGYSDLNFWGVIRPNFASSIPLVTPTISFNKSSYTVGDTITVSWTPSPSNSNLSHYWIVVTDPAGKEIIGEGVDKSKTSFSFSTSSVGSYTVKVFATPSGSSSGEGSLTDTKSVTVNAKVTLCKITYDANGGSLGSVPASQTYTYATTGTTRLTYEEPTRAGYTFLGWSLSKTATSPSYTCGHEWLLSNKGDYTLYAVWARATFQVSIRPADGEIDGSTDSVVKNYAYGSVFTLPQPTRKGYDFVCWTLDYSGSNHILEPWGTPLHHDPSFSSTLSDILVYNNGNNGAVTIEKVIRSSDCPTSSLNMLKITTTGTAIPDLGGFMQLTDSKASGVFYHMIIAKIPVGYTINRASNACGDGAKTVWLTSQEGTGEFEVYIYKTTCGSTGKFSTLGHVYISGEEATQSEPLVWYVGYSEIFDGTGISDSGKYTVGAGMCILRAIWKKHEHSCDIKCDKCEAEGTVTHEYDNTCDTSCNVCGFTRSIEHTYTNECDRDCNVCGEFRRAPHKYDNACDDTCGLCGNEREADEHQYSNACDTTCNECGATRTVPDHVYDNACDKTCNVCGFDRIPEEHKYANTCDTNCDVCGEERTITHTYTKECSMICDVCGNVREAIADHTYTNICDAICNECGETRNTRHTYSNSCDSDCNVCGFIRTVEHTFTNECDNECDICYETRKAPHKYDGVCDAECNLCGKTRTVPEHTYGYDLVCDECGYKNFVLGDIDGTGVVDLNDVNNIARYFAGWDIDCNEAALDVDGDGLVNLNDLIHLAQYVAGWQGIELH